MKKKLLIFHPALAPYLVDQYNAISKLFELEVVFLFDNVWNHKFDQSKLLSQLEFNYSFLLKGPCYKGRLLRFGMLGAIKKFQPDLIMGYEYSITTQYLILLKKLGFINQPLGSSVDDSLEICYNVQSKAREIARKVTVKQLDFLVLLSNEVAKYYEDEFKLTPKQLVVSPLLQNPDRLRKNNVELEAIATKYVQKYNLKDKKVLLFVGRFIPEKAIPIFVKNIAPVLRSNDDLRFVIVGDGEQRHEIETIIKEEQISDKVILPGRFEALEVNAWYLCASGFALPSTYEPFGAVVNEALIFGLKVFCSKYAGSSYLIGDKCGMLFDPLNVTETIDNLNQFVDEIQPIDTVSLVSKPPLVTDDNENFVKEWGKLIYD